MTILKAITVALALVASALGATVLTTGSAAAATSDPCFSAGYVRTAWGDVGAAGWYAHPSYNVGYDNRSPWGGASNGVDHNLQWEMTYQSSTRTARFCVRNLKAIGRTATMISTELARPDGSTSSTALTAVNPVAAGAGWVLMSGRYLPLHGSYRVYFGDYWAGGQTHGWSDVVLRSYPSCTSAATGPLTPLQLSAVTPAGC